MTVLKKKNTGQLTDIHIKIKSVCFVVFFSFTCGYLHFITARHTSDIQLKKMALLLIKKKKTVYFCLRDEHVSKQQWHSE